MSRIPPPKEPSGCVQTAIITGVILQILAVPLAMILGAIFAVLFALYAYATHPLLGLAVIVLFGVVLAVVGRWEYNRALRDMPPEE